MSVDTCFGIYASPKPRACITSTRQTWIVKFKGLWRWLTAVRNWGRNKRELVLADKIVSTMISEFFWVLSPCSNLQFLTKLFFDDSSSWLRKPSNLGPSRLDKGKQHQISSRDKMTENSLNAYFCSSCKWTRFYYWVIIECFQGT